MSEIILYLKMKQFFKLNIWKAKIEVYRKMMDENSWMYYLSTQTPFFCEKKWTNFYENLPQQIFALASIVQKTHNFLFTPHKADAMVILELLHHSWVKVRAEF